MEIKMDNAEREQIVALLKSIKQNEKYQSIIEELEKRIKEIEDNIDYMLLEEGKLKHFYNYDNLYCDNDIAKCKRQLWYGFKNKFIQLEEITGINKIIEAIDEKIKFETNQIYNVYFARKIKFSQEDMDKMERHDLIEMVQLVDNMITEFEPQQQSENIDPYNYEKNV
jgi:hypothetical protein